MALPKWPGASVCYSRAQRLLQHMADNAGTAHDVTMPKSGEKNPYQALRKSRSFIRRTPDMDELICALNEGDEERIKGLLLQHNAVEVVG